MPARLRAVHCCCWVREERDEWAESTTPAVPQLGVAVDSAAAPLAEGAAAGSHALLPPLAALSACSRFKNTRPSGAIHTLTTLVRLIRLPIFQVGGSGPSPLPSISLLAKCALAA